MQTRAMFGTAVWSLGSVWTLGGAVARAFPMAQVCGQLVLALLAVAPAVTMAQAPDENEAVESEEGMETEREERPRVDPDERVLKYDLSGPRFGATFSPRGEPVSQFGWHFESQAAPSKHGPWFIVEKVFLVRGVEYNRFMPSGTLMFGMRLPNSFEFGFGPSVSLGGVNGFNSGVVGAIGQSFRVGGIRIPVNLAYAANRGGEHRWTLLTGWAIRDLVGRQKQQPVERMEPAWPRKRGSI